jgi:hypothetical protein
MAGETARFIWAWSWRLALAAWAVAMIFWERPVARWLPAPLSWVQDTCIAMLGAVTVSVAWAVARRSDRRRRQIWQVRSVRGPGEKDLAAQARMHLARVRYLQTYTSGWSGTVHLPGGAVKGQRSRSVARAGQPLSYPEIVDDFRRFAQVVAEEAHRRGDRVFIGVDELDKIGTPDQAERFLNEIKGIFGIPHVYFMVSVSDDARAMIAARAATAWSARATNLAGLGVPVAPEGRSFRASSGSWQADCLHNSAGGIWSSLDSN